MLFKQTLDHSEVGMQMNELPQLSKKSTSQDRFNNHRYK